MNGAINLADRTWTNRSNVTAPLIKKVSGRLACPLCRIDRHDEILFELPITHKYYCVRGHYLHTKTARPS
jgi:hypothetical protein